MNGQFPSAEEIALFEMLSGGSASAPRQVEVAGYYGVQGNPAEVGYYDIQGGEQWYTAMGAENGGYAGRGTQPYPARMSPAHYPTGPQPPGALTVVKRDPQTSRVLFVGFRSAALVGAGLSATVVSTPNDTIAPRKVIVPPSSAPSFDIDDIKVGSNSQFGSGDPVPAETFLPDSMNTDVRFDTAQIAQPITFVVSNIGAAAARFRASINGFVVRL